MSTQALNLGFLLVVLVLFTPSSCLRLVKIPGGLKHVSGSINYLWGVNAEDKVFRCNRPCLGSWVHVEGSLKQIDVGEDEIWGVNSNDAVFKRAADGSGKWQYINSQKLKHVSASGNGYIWGVNSADQIYKCKKPCSGSWVLVPGGLKQIDGGQEYVYGVDKSNNVFSMPVDGSEDVWRQIPGAMHYITASETDDIFAIGASKSNIYRCKKPCIGEWEWMSGSLVQCDATFGALIGVDSHNTIYKHRLPVR